MQTPTKPTHLVVIIDAERQFSFSEPFRIGRDEECELVLQSGLVSRIHARVEFENDRWCIKDLDSTNGTYVGGEKVSVVELSTTHAVQFGVNGPLIEFSVKTHVVPLPDKSTARTKKKNATRHKTNQFGTAASNTDSTPSSGDPHRAARIPEVNHYIDHYFGEGGDAQAGEHTQFIRIAYKKVQHEQKKQFTALIIGIALLSICSLVFGLYQHQRRNQIEGLAVSHFNSKKQLDLQIVTLKRSIEKTGLDLNEQFELLEKQRQENARTYDGYIRELGLYRKLTEKERAIYDVARIFNENEFGMPASFVGEVMEKIDRFWLGSHRERYIQAIERAENLGYTSYIVRAMQSRGLPPEFFYLALQESDLRNDRSGPSTRWGIAKGMWQFIPMTATRFGLNVGPRQNQRVFDELDDRNDFYKSTDAAAAYLQEIYGTLAQASGLLVMASYNWGEHRIADKLTSLPGKRPLREEVFEGIPNDPNHRNYWAFLTQYEKRMPDETKDYVLKIFSAAVIGHDPKLWGLEMSNPLLNHIEKEAL